MMLEEIKKVERLEVSVVRLVEVDEDSHNFAGLELSGSVSSFFACSEWVMWVKSFEVLTKVID